MKKGTDPTRAKPAKNEAMRNVIIMFANVQAKGRAAFGASRLSAVLGFLFSFNGFFCAGNRHRLSWCNRLFGQSFVSNSLKKSITEYSVRLCRSI